MQTTPFQRARTGRSRQELTTASAATPGYIRSEPAMRSGALGLTGRAIRHDELNLLVLDRVAAHLASVRRHAAVAIDTVETP
jgi:hypothetical protein